MFGYTIEKLKELKAVYTATEIEQQPRFWRVTYDIIKEREAKVKVFLKKNVDENTRIVLTGAGTSDYVGDTICSYVDSLVKARVESIATTDIVADPGNVIEPDTKTILVSFARSGNSPESVGAYSLFEENVRDIKHIVITCNKEGNLAKRAGVTEDNFTILLPEETDDKSFAMTSSFSCMMLSAILFFDIKNIDKNKQLVDIIAAQGQEILDNQWRTIKELSEAAPKRIVYLGTGCFHGLAQELALKNMELTNGRIATIQESVLGFRHGPKTFLDDNTVVVVLTSQDDYSNLYNKDLIQELYNDTGNHKVVVISYQEEEEIKNFCHTYITVAGRGVPEVYACLNYVLYGQLFGLFNSIRLGISPDNPSPDGTVNRVVKGVTIHKYCAED